MTQRFVAGDEATLVPSTARSASEPPYDLGAEAPRDDIACGTVIARYVVLDRVGAGGMGVVYAAYDPRLDRRVALKLISRPSGSPRGASRMLREAQAMARLNHPNVVTIHDVGLHGDRTFLAMEFVEGKNLAAWIAERHPSWQKAAALLLQAGRRLAAAHAHGIVHGDFKPDNVLLADDGRVLVTDFGLARELDGDSNDGPPTTDDEVQPDGRTDATAGTPAYMAPEQFAGGPRTPATDQFSFCVAAYEAIFGERPFPTESLGELVDAVLRGEVREPPAARRGAVPTRLRAAILRGLAREPERRFPDLAPVLAALADDPGRRRRVWLGAGLGSLALCLGGAGVVLHDPKQRMCEAAGARIDAVWNNERRANLAHAFVASELPQANAAWTAVDAAVAAYAAEWRQAVVATCSATHTRGEQSHERLDVRMDCLQARRERIDALLSELATADSTAIERAPQAAMSLPRIAACNDPAVRGRDATPEQLAAIAEARMSLATAEARLAGGRYAVGVDATSDSLAAIADVDVPWFRAEVLLARAKLQTLAGDPAGARATIDEGLRLAAIAGDPSTTANLWLEWLHVVGDVQLDPQAALAMTLPIELAVLAAGNDIDLQRQHATVLANVEDSAGQFEAAETHRLRALSLGEQLDPGPLARAVLHGNYGNTLHALGRFVQAREQHERALELVRTVLGEDHPEVAHQISRVARDASHLGDPERARELHLHALAVREASLGPRHLLVGEDLINLATVEYTLHELEASFKHAERALDLYLANQGGDHPNVAAVHNHLGNLAHRISDYPRALSHFGEVERIYTKRFGADHPNVAIALSNKANVLLDLGDYSGALAASAAALAIREARLGPDHVALAFHLLTEARALAKLGRAAEGVPLAERAVALREGRVFDAADLSFAHHILATVLWDANTDREQRQRALAEGRRALTIWRASNLDDAPRLELYETWLRTHGGNTSLTAG